MAENKHYLSGEVPTRQKRSMVAKYLEGHLTNDQWDDASRFLEYFDRMGLKDDAQKDAYKCADYLHRFLKGIFLNEVEAIENV